MAQHLVVGVDGSNESAVALRWAVDEAARRELEIELIYALAIPVVSDAYGMVMTRPDVDELAEYSEELLGAAEKVARSYDPDLVVSSRLLHGPPAAVLLEASKHAAAMVLGTRGVGAINRRALGSVSIRVAAKSACPVYVIPPDYDPVAATGDPVVVGVDGSPHGDAALKVALDDARCRDALLRVVSAYHVPWLARPIEPSLISEFQQSERQLAGKIVDQALARVQTQEYQSVKVDVSLMECPPTEALITAGKESILTVVGSRGRSAISRALLGSVSRAVMQDASRPVAVVHCLPTKRDVP